MLNEWDGIEAITTGGDYSWDNNLIERINRYISLSRKNSLFFGSHAGAERGCIFYSLACSCRLHKINFFEYLTDILNRADVLQRSATLEAYRDILPDRWKKKSRASDPAFLMLIRHPGDAYISFSYFSKFPKCKNKGESDF